MPQSNSSHRFAVLVLLLALVGSASMLDYHLGMLIPAAQHARAAIGLGNGYSAGNDFYQVWLTSRSRLRGDRDLYSDDTTRRIQTGLYGRPLNPQAGTDPVDRRAFPYPAFTDLLFWPFAELPFPMARALMFACLAVSLFATVSLWMSSLAWPRNPVWRAVVYLFVFFSYSGLEALYAGQIGLIVGLLLSASIFALQRGWLTASGAFMALATMKPQVSLLLIGYLLLWACSNWRARKRFCLGLISTGGVLLGASLLVWPDWVPSWIHSIVSYHRYTPAPLVTTVLAEPLGPRASGLVTFLLTGALLATAGYLAWRHRSAEASHFEFQGTVSLLLAIAVVTLVPGQAVYDHLILLPGILLLAGHQVDIGRLGRVPRWLLALGAAALLWPWAAALALIVLQTVLTSPLSPSNAAFFLPIRTAASFPFLVIVLLLFACTRITPRVSESA